MKTHQHHPKLKTQPCPLFSCGFFRHCTQSVLSPTNSQSPPLPLTPQQTPRPPLPPPPPQPPLSTHPPESSSSSSSTSQSFTQWKFPFPLPTSPIHPQSQPDPEPLSNPKPIYLPPKPLPPPIPYTSLQELFHLAELQLTTGSQSDQLAALYLLERSLVPNPPSDHACQPELMRGVVANLKNKAGAKPATKVLLALCLAESNRHVAVEAGAVGAVIEVVAELDSAAGERALAALELMCTVAEGAAEVRAHALSVPVMVTMMGQMAGRGKEYAISVIAVIYGGGDQIVLAAPPEEVARAVALALQGDCTARGRRKGTQLLKALNEYGGLDGNEEEHQQL
ncbi:E3 ubiquitin-protein ligase PUB23 [Mangifera indica]|uniref:E3 ubiquitin-protein ligase PUB23 n=1 Tax=Mangifera indica TaxID=29780 RepID=UPI001CFA1AFC|nr:E3 ubiquitin-protein ligase PUB23 [Mangifera indica]